MDNERFNLIDKISKYLDSDEAKQSQTNLEVSPNKFTIKKRNGLYTKSSINNLIKDNISILDQENKIICDNILISFFDLNNDKFLMCLEKINEWGFNIAFKEFIINYYLRIIKDNKLRNYILINIDSIITLLKNQLEVNMINSIKHFNFTTLDTDHEIDLIKNDIAARENSMLGIQSKNFNEFAPVEDDTKIKLDPSKKRSYRLEILNRLKYENPKLLE